MTKSNQNSFNNLSEFQKSRMIYTDRTDNIYRGTPMYNSYKMKRTRQINNFRPVNTNTNWSTPYSMPSPHPSIQSIQATSMPCRSLGAIPF